jgi:diguanylate cyclase (GGDEF)-like protein/PAS domain S-box-containing protein
VDDSRSAATGVPVPLDEDLRLKTLRSYEVLDTIPESDLDDLALLASYICETPIALISLIDEDRQWFKSAVGLDTRQTPRDQAFCAHAIASSDELFVVEDAATDARFVDNPLVVGDPGIRFYAGAPLVSSEGQALGTLCVIDREPKQLRPDQQIALQALARQVMSRLEQRRTGLAAAHEVADALRTGDTTAADVNIAAAFERSSVGLVVTDLTGRVIRTNPALAALHGAEAVGMSYRDLLDPDDVPEVERALRDLVAGAASCLVTEVGLVTAGGPVRPVTLTTAAVRDDDGKTTLLLSLVEDAAARVAAEDDLTENWTGAEAVVSADSTGRIRSWNRAAERLFGWTKDEAIGRPLAMLMPERYRAAHVAGLRRFVETGETRLSGSSVEIEALTKDGSEIFIELTLSKWSSPEGIGFTGVFRDVSARREMKAELDETRRKLSELIGNLPGLVYRCRNDADWTAEVASDGAYELTGWTADDLVGGVVTLAALIHPDDRERVAHEVAAALQEGDRFRIRYRMLHRDGTVRWVVERGQGVFAADGTVEAIEGFITDVTDRTLAEQALEREARFLRVLERVATSANEAASVEDALVTCVEEVVALTGWPIGHAFVVDPDSKLLQTSQWQIEAERRFELFREFTDSRLFGPGVGLPGRVQLSGRPEWVGDLSAAGNFPRNEVAAVADVHAGFAFPILVGAEVVAVCEFFSETAAEPDQKLLDLVAQIGTIVGRVVERTRSRDHLSRLALHDPLTGLPNRNLLQDRLRNGLARGRRDGHWPVLAFIDLDRFKVVNDSLGHVAGDQLLLSVARRLQRIVRPTDTVARLGGDEFVVLLDTSREATDIVVDRIRQSFTEPFDLEDRSVFCTASIGTVETDATATVESALRDADAAMYAAKAAGGDRAERFDQGMHTAAVKRLEIEHDLRRALDAGEMELHYQPTVALGHSRITGVEALVRWRHPERGMVSPLDFIPVAEETGLIVPLGQWVLDTACAQAASWRQAGDDVRVAINVSFRQIEEPEFVDEVRAVLARHDLEPSAIVLELTESTLARNPGQTLDRLQELAAVGVGLAADDFGTGYSSLSYLQRFPLDVVKVDKSFVDGVGIEPEATALVSAIVQMARALDLQVVAEGVETADQAAALAHMGCDYGQGYHFARPLPAQQVQALFAHPVGSGSEPRAQLSAVLTEAAASADLEGVVRPLLEAMSLLTGLESTFVAEFDWDAQEHRILYSRNVDDELELPEGLVTPLRQTPCHQAVIGTGPRSTTEASEDFATSPVVQALRLQTYLAVPIELPGRRTFGVLCGTSRRRVAVGPEQTALTEVLSRLIVNQLLQEQALEVERARADAAERHLRDRSLFLAQAEHKLKTPLTVIRGWAETLQDWDRLETKTVQHGTGAMLEHSNRLLRQVDGLLQQARAEIITTDLVLERIAADRFVRSQAIAFGTVSKAHPVVVTSASRAAVRADREALHQVLGHLIDNAVKFSPAGGQIELEARRRGERIEITVADGGPGLPPGVDVFAAFERATAVGEPVDGVGLGLHIVRTLVESMDGTIKATENARGGASFVISLPVAA